VRKANRDDILAVETDVTRIANALRRGAGNELGSDWASRLVGYLFYDSGGEARANQKEIGEAVTWLEQNGRQYFLNNPGELADFQRDALAWYRHAVKGSAREGAPVQEVQGGPPRGFDSSIGLIFNLEGGYVPAKDGDPGGETNMGITQKWSSKYLPKGTALKDITRDQAAKIYKSEYWDKINANNLGPALQLVAFDAAVNQGVPQTKKWLAEIKKAGFSDEEAAQQLLQLRFNHYEELATGENAAVYAKYLGGWHSRLEQVEAALELRMGSTRPVTPGLHEQPDPVYTPPATASAPVQAAPAQGATITPQADPATAGLETPAEAPIVDPAEQKKAKKSIEAGLAQTVKNPTAVPKRFANVKLMNLEVQKDKQDYDNLTTMMRLARRAGLGAEFARLRALRGAAAVRLTHVAQQKAIDRFLQGDQTMLEQMWGQSAGQRVALQKRSDGRWNIFNNGQNVDEAGFSSNDIANSAWSAASSVAAKQMRDAERSMAATRADKIWEAQLKQLGYISAEKIEAMKINGKVQFNPTDGSVWIGGSPFMLMPAEEKNGVKLPARYIPLSRPQVGGNTNAAYQHAIRVK